MLVPKLAADICDTGTRILGFENHQMHMSDTVPDAESRSVTSDSSVSMLDCHSDSIQKHGGGITYQSVNSNLIDHKVYTTPHASTDNTHARHAHVFLLRLSRGTWPDFILWMPRAPYKGVQ